MKQPASIPLSSCLLAFSLFFTITRAEAATGYAITDDVVVDTVSVGPPVLDLESFYESNSGQSVTVDATPIEGGPTNFAYQWYFNGIPLPSFEGGTVSAFTVDGALDREGTWRVVVTNSEGSAEASFEYRVFTDSDGDGLSDYRENNITKTKPNLLDSDSDGLNDYAEVIDNLTDPNDSDSDDDGLNDGAEVNSHGSDPLASDSSGDGLSDGYVVTAGFNPNTNYSALLSADAMNARGYYTPAQLQDARAGAVIIEATGSTASLQLQIERSEDLTNWTQHENDLISVPMQMNGNKQFFRFAIPQE